MYIYDNILLSFSYNEQYFRQKLQTKSHILRSTTFFYVNRAVYVITWENTVLPGRL